MTSIKQRDDVRPIPGHGKRIDTDIAPATGSQLQAIYQSDILEAPYEQIESMVVRGMHPDTAANIEESSGANSTGFQNTPADDDFYDFSEYDEDNPREDPDRRSHHSPSWDRNDFEATEGNLSISPTPDIVIDVFGEVRIPLEGLLVKYYGHNLISGEENLSPLAGRILTKARLLRTVAEALMKKVGHFILSGNADPTNLSLPPLTQKEIMQPLGLDKHRFARLANHYIETPYWGIQHFSFFFQGKWQEAITEIKRLLNGEEPANPYGNRHLYEILEKSASKEFKDNRQYRNILKAAGIPLAKSRRDLHDCVIEWCEDQQPRQIKILKISHIRETLIKDYPQFFTGQTKQCLEPHYVTFVEARILMVLKALGIKLIQER